MHKGATCPPAAAAHCPPPAAHCPPPAARRPPPAARHPPPAACRRPRTTAATSDVAPHQPARLHPGTKLHAMVTAVDGSTFLAPRAVHKLPRRHAPAWKPLGEPQHWPFVLGLRAGIMTGLSADTAPQRNRRSLRSGTSCKSAPTSARPSPGKALGRWWSSCASRSSAPTSLSSTRCAAARVHEAQIAATPHIKAPLNHVPSLKSRLIS